MANTTKKYVSIEKLGLYDSKIKQHIANADIAVLDEAKLYADNLADNYDAAGSAATAKSEAISEANNETTRQVNALADGQVKLNKEAIEAIKDDANIDSFADVVAELAKKQNTGDYATKSEAQGYADAKDEAIAEAKAAADAAQSDVDDLAELVGTLPEGTSAATVVEYVNVKTSGIATDAALGELQGQLSGVQGEVATIKGDYLKSSDKTELQGNINAVSDVANAAVKQSDYDVKVAALEAEDLRIAGLVATEQTRAEGVEAGIVERLIEVETFFKTAEGQIIDEAMDTLVEIQKYITDDGAAADEMMKNIAANAKAIEDHGKLDHDFASADATLKSELEGKINLKADKTTVEGIDTRLGEAEGTLATAVGDVSELKGKVSGLETASATHALKTEVEAVAEDLQEYVDAHKSDYTNAQIDAAIKVNTDAIAQLNDTYATDAELAQAIENEVTRANGAYAAKSLETTVSDHKTDTVAHVTAIDKTLWNAALQASDVVEGGTNGTISVKGTAVAVKGLGSAAFTDASAYDVAGAAAGVQNNLNTESQRAKDAEKALQDAINAFEECSEGDIKALFNESV